MRISILYFVFFSIIICSFEYGKNVLHFINESNVYLERNIINLENNRILADANNKLDLNHFYESTLSLADQLNDCSGEDDDDEDTQKFRNIIYSHIKKHKESNTLPDLNNVDKKRKKIIYELQKELDEVKKELDEVKKDIGNIRNNKLETQPIQDKRIVNRDEVVSVSNYEDLNRHEDLRLITENEENAVNTTADDRLKDKQELKIIRKGLLLRGCILAVLTSLLLIPVVNIWVSYMIVGLSIETLFRCYQFSKLTFKVYNVPKKMLKPPKFLKP
ncbi:fam-b protein [Plasmodium vinckei vinckei]|uniref:Fam-b protein n=1 Tax=Plasmodium vinckei vinckei TaxID=54757 RepID=A0A449BX99_PLAVN|nr:fam-b protein [Plasmodium vinckei vinckei]VEV58074.1 fam-b protein [Plasmodium vinckei vinckei]